MPKDVAEVLQCNPHFIRVQAKDGTLPFPYVMSGCRTKIPRLSFIKWMEGTLGPEEKEEPRYCE